MQNIEENLKKINVVLPEPASPVATYVPYNIVDNLLFISGQGPFDGSKLITGKVGDESVSYTHLTLPTIYSV